VDCVVVGWAKRILPGSSFLFFPVNSHPTATTEPGTRRFQTEEGWLAGAGARILLPAGLT